jgi:hypothetical protein
MDNESEANAFRQSVQLQITSEFTTMMNEVSNKLNKLSQKDLVLSLETHPHPNVLAAEVIMELALNTYLGSVVKAAPENNEFRFMQIARERVLMALSELQEDVALKLADVKPAKAE